MPIQPEDRSVKVNVTNGATNPRGLGKVQDVRQKGIQGMGFGLGYCRSRPQDNQQQESQ